MAFAERLARARRIKATGYGYGESGPFYVWNSEVASPCGHPVEGLAKLCRILMRDRRLYATGRPFTPARSGPFLKTQ